jgi:hypothetical protein
MPVVLPELGNIKPEQTGSLSAQGPTPDYPDVRWCAGLTAAAHET